jgi:hypothetical protein
MREDKSPAAACPARILYCWKSVSVWRVNLRKIMACREIKQENGNKCPGRGDEQEQATVVSSSAIL